MADCTILLPLKDRPEYTKRMMNSLQENGCPFKIIIADGGKNSEIENILSNPSSYSGIDFDYIRYPYDASFHEFYEKMSDAVGRIKTPFVAVLDNDDLLHIDGFSECVEILQDESFSSARGRIDDMSGRSMYTDFPNNITGKTACDRMIDQTNHFHGNWHNVTRTNHVQACWEMINVIKPKNMRFTEQLTGYLNVIWGDGFRGNFPWLIHDNGERIQTEDGSLQDHFPDQETWINSNYWLEEFNKMTEVIGVSIAHCDGISVYEAMDSFCKTYPDKLPHLRNLLDKRIEHAISLGYNKERMDTLYKICRNRL